MILPAGQLYEIQDLRAGSTYVASPVEETDLEKFKSADPIMFKLEKPAVIGGFEVESGTHIPVMKGYVVFDRIGAHNMGERKFRRMDAQRAQHVKNVDQAKRLQFIEQRLAKLEKLLAKQTPDGEPQN
jgi:hypothetical protein